jgi:hypothetical protein
LGVEYIRAYAKGVFEMPCHFSVVKDFAEA